MSNPLLKAAGITPDTLGHEAERALFEAAWKCVNRLRDSIDSDGTSYCCGAGFYRLHTTNCPLAAFDEATKFFQEDV